MSTLLAYYSSVPMLRQDSNDPTTYHVAVEDGTDISTFSGKDALDKAIFFASTYYPNWGDPTDLAKGGRV